MDEYLQRGRQTKLEWALDSSTIRALRNSPESSNWICGDRKKLHQTISYFIKHTSIHGIHLICPTGRKISCFKRTLYILFFAFCVLSMCGSVVLLLQDTLSTESLYITVTSKDYYIGIDEDPYFPWHPQVTVCRRPTYRMDVNTSYREFLEYAYLSLGFPYASFSPNEMSLMISYLRYRMHKKEPTPEMEKFAMLMRQLANDFKKLKSNVENFNLTLFLIENSLKCEDIFIRCDFIIFSVPCCNMFQPILTNYGYCYSLLLPKEQLLTSKKELTYFFLFDLHAIPRIPKAVNIGYEIFLSDPRYKDGLFSDAGYYTLNGHELVMRTKLMKTSREAIYTPWHGFYSNCPRLEPELDVKKYGERYFLESCIRNYLNRNVRIKCKCRIVTDTTDLTLQECGPEKQFCVINIALRDNLTGLNEVCKHPCIEYHYETTTNLVKIGDNNISRLIFVFDRNEYSLEEYKLTTISSFLSLIGGAMGLYLGASIITALEVIIFVAASLYYRFLPHKRVSTTSQLQR